MKTEKPTILTPEQVCSSLACVTVESVIEEIEHLERGDGATTFEKAVILMGFFGVPEARKALAALDRKGGAA